MNVREAPRSLSRLLPCSEQTIWASSSLPVTSAFLSTCKCRLIRTRVSNPKYFLPSPLTLVHSFWHEEVPSDLLNPRLDGLLGTQETRRLPEMDNHVRRHFSCTLNRIQLSGGPKKPGLPWDHSQSMDTELEHLPASPRVLPRWTDKALWLEEDSAEFHAQRRGDFILAPLTFSLPTANI